MAREHSYNTGRASREGAQGRENAMATQKSKKNPRKKMKKLNVFLTTLAVVVAIVVAGAGGVYLYVGGMLKPGVIGITDSQYYTPKEFQADSVNILIVGIDYEEGRYSGDGLGMTDMIMVANFLPREGKLNLFQIPRDAYVGTEYSSDGKINAALMSGKDKENPINNLISVISDQYKLPIDYYITLDMDGLKAIIDTFGGIRVYVPKAMTYDGSHLDAGWQWLNGDQVEFFVRNRKGPGMERADLDRLENQRYFYSALFRRFMNLAPADIVKLMPVFEHYCNTDIGMKSLINLAYSALNLNKDGIIMFKAPGATDADEWSSGLGFPALTTTDNTFYVVDIYGRGTEEEPGVAALMNMYMRTYGEQVSADQLAIPPVHIPSSVTLYSPSVQNMGAVQEDEGGADIDVEPTPGG